MVSPLLLLLFWLGGPAKTTDILNTAAQCKYMRQTERDMIREVNYVRTNPAQYAALLKPYLKEAEANLKADPNSKNYAISTRYETVDGVEKVRIDTTWFNYREEEVNAIKSLISELDTMKPLRILQPDPGIYRAAKFHAEDNSAHNWELSHRGSDGSWPWDRIRRFASNMKLANENLAGHGDSTARASVILLLIDSGIPGYGHRRNLLNPDWTHIGCYYGGFAGGMHRWVQNFGKKKD